MDKKIVQNLSNHRKAVDNFFTCQRVAAIKEKNRVTSHNLYDAKKVEFTVVNKVL